MLRLQGLHPAWLQDVHWEYFMLSIMALEGQQTWSPMLAHSDPRHPNFCNKNRRVTPASVIVECSGLGGGDLNLDQPWHVCIRTNKHKQQVYGPSLALLEESVRISDQSTIQITGLGLTKSLQEFLVRLVGLISSVMSFLKFGGHRQVGCATWQETSTGGSMLPRHTDGPRIRVGLDQ